MAGGDTSKLGRRAVLGRAGAAVAGLGLAALGLGHVARRPAGAAHPALRPPGAAADFLAACLRCGLCVRDCPYGTLRLADVMDDPAPGTPFFTPRRVACEMCEDLPCIRACPSGALDPAVTNPAAIRMGTAVLIDHENCLNWQGLRCDVCYRVCPLIDQAITLDERHNQRTGKHAMFLPTVHADQCTGCGKCEHACVLDVAAIKVVPAELARGAMGAHYRLGWREKAANGGRPLIDGTIQLPVRRPEEGDGR